jgi:hypothetical protein
VERAWYHQRALLQAALDEHGTIAAAARAHGMPRTTLASAAERVGITGPRTPPPAVTPASSEPRVGVTYVIEAVGEGLFKIGRTGGDPRARLQQLRTMSPVPLELVLVLDHLGWEPVLHHHYRDRRRHGEWFALTINDLDELTGWALPAHSDEIPRCASGTTSSYDFADEA